MFRRLQAFRGLKPQFSDFLHPGIRSCHNFRRQYELWETGTGSFHRWSFWGPFTHGVMVNWRMDPCIELNCRRLNLKPFLKASLSKLISKPTTTSLSYSNYLIYLNLIINFKIYISRSYFQLMCISHYCCCWGWVNWLLSYMLTPLSPFIYWLGWDAKFPKLGARSLELILILSLSLEISHKSFEFLRLDSWFGYTNGDLFSVYMNKRLCFATANVFSFGCHAVS